MNTSVRPSGRSYIYFSSDFRPELSLPRQLILDFMHARGHRVTLPPEAHPSHEGILAEIRGLIGRASSCVFLCSGSAVNAGIYLEIGLSLAQERPTHVFMREPGQLVDHPLLGAITTTYAFSTVKELEAHLDLLETRLRRRSGKSRAAAPRTPKSVHQLRALLHKIKLPAGFLFKPPYIDERYASAPRMEEIQRLVSKVELNKHTLHLPADHVCLGNCLFALGEIDRAEAAYEGALQRDSRYVPALNNLALLTISRGDFAGGERQLQRSLDEASGAGDVEALAGSLLNLGQLYSARGDPKEAIGLYGRAVDLYRQTGLSSRIGQTNLLYGDALTQLGDYQTALAAYRGASEEWLGSGDYERASLALQRMARVAKQQLRLDEGVDLLRRALSISDKVPRPRHRPSILRELGELMIQLGRFGEALPYAQEAQKAARSSENNREEARALVLMARLASRLDRPGDALSYLERAYEALPTDADIARELGRAYGEDGHYDEAEAWLRRARYQASEAQDSEAERDILSDLTLVLRATGRPDEANDLLERVGELSTLEDEHVAVDDESQ